MEITRELLIREGFLERMINGSSMYVKNQFAVLRRDGMWIPCNIEGQPKHTNVYVNTMEELMRLMEETHDR
jgi:hypothetical protein